MHKLSYEPLTSSHATALLPIWADETVILYTNVQTPCSLQEIEEKIALFQTYDTFIVRLQDEVVGIIGCPHIGESYYGVFYQFQQSAWGKGIASQSANWLIAFMRQKYTQITFYAEVVADNVASG